MSEELDNKLRERISEVFEHYEDTAPAQEGWLLLRQKFPEKKEKRRIIPLWWSAAAVLLVLCLFGTWLYTRQPEYKGQVAAQKPALKPSKDSAVAIKPTLHGGNSNTTAPNNTRKNSDEVNEQLANATKSSTNKTLIPATGLANVSHQKQQDQLRSTDDVAPTASSTALNSPAVIAANAIQTPPSYLDHVDSSKTVQHSTLAAAKQPVVKSATAKSITDSAEKQQPSRMEQFLANEQKKEQNKKPDANKVTADKKILYSVYAGTFVNYAEGSKSQANVGAGFTTDIKLAGNLKLSTGVAIARNSLSYNGQPAQARILNAAIQASTRLAGDAVYAAPPIGGGANNYTALGIVPARVASNPVVAGYNINLTGLDIPINLKYEFNASKTDTYISAGLSSGTFINETFNYSYDNSTNALSKSPSIPDASTSRSFAGFDFARTLNVSVGMGYQITKSNRLVIEPFLKYPLNGVGSQQIRFGAGGVNLKLRFQTSKK